MQKIISGGQTGADRAALDVALKYDIEHGGWIPAGRRAEDGPLPVKYRMKETESRDYRERTRLNVTDSHGTVILFRGELTGGSRFTETFARVSGRPVMAVDLMMTEEFEAAVFITSFIRENQIRVLNVAGPRLSSLPGIYEDVKTILEAGIYLLYLDTRQDLAAGALAVPDPVSEDFPGDLESGLALIYQDLPLKTRIAIARAGRADTPMLYFTFLDYLRRRLGFDTGNPVLLKHCATLMEDPQVTIEDAIMMILKEFKYGLEKDHILRVVS